MEMNMKYILMRQWLSKQNLKILNFLKTLMFMDLVIKL